jgi:N,N'-diacetyllegionaminate synthase
VIVGTRNIDDRALLVAEVGVNHEGDFEKARALLQLAARAGADAVKFQAYYVRDLRFVSPTADPDRFQRMQKNELTWDQFHVLADDAKREGVMFLCTCFDRWTVDALDDVLPAHKVASGDLTNDELLSAIAETGKPVLLSTGMSTDDEIGHALEVLAGGRDIRSLADRVVLMQCTSSYPCPPEQVNLRAMLHMRRRYGVRVGYSDHTLDTLACEAAIGLGACVIEKHFTDQKAGRAFRDHALSADGSDFRRLVGAVRAIERLLGEEAKTVQPAESAAKGAMRRSLGVRHDLDAGAVITADVLIALRPSLGWPVRDAGALVGRRLARSLSAGDLITAADLVPDKTLV